jgi:uncharacterized protein (DUF2252 family)
MQGDWSPPAGRDPIGLILEQNQGRFPWLVPVRHQRMSQSAFAFYRGGAKVMAADLANSPVTGIEVQLCGDAHISNFGFFGSPERRLLFDVNDFDETLPGPWEWDVKRLAASIVIAARHAGHSEKEANRATLRALELYQQGIRDLARQKLLDTWYASLSIDEISEVYERVLGKGVRRRVDKFAEKARRKNSAQVLEKLGVEQEGGYRIASDPPFLVPLRELPFEAGADEQLARIERGILEYRDTLASNRRRLLERFRPVDIALKVVGVGSVGTACFVVLLEGRDEADPLFLQMKEATASVLEDHLPKSEYDHCGHRVVAGQRLMQAASDIFLGWNTGDSGRQYYWRQLKDMKGSVDLDDMDPDSLRVYAAICGWTLARAHARSGDDVAIAAYLGSGDRFGRVLVDFANAYADQNEEDYRAFMAAIDAGRIEVADEVD